jgi:predicted MFS family arabinose efflux permease
MDGSGKSGNTKKFNTKAWVVVIAIFIAGIAMAWAQNKVMPVIGLVQVDLSVDAATAGWISGIFNILGIVLAFPAVGMVRKLGIFKGGIISIAATLVGSVMGFFAPEQYILLASRIIEGFGIGLISVIAPSTIAMWFPIEKRGLPMGVWSSWQMVAIAACFLFAGNIIGPDSAWKHMWIIGIVVLAFALLIFIWKVRTPTAEENFADVEDSTVKITEVFKHPSVYIISIGGMGFGMAIMTFATWIVTFWTSAAGMDVGLASSIVGYVYLAEIFTAIMGGAILDRVKNKKRFVAIDGFLYGFVFLAAFYLTSWPGIIAVCILYCVIEGIFAAAMWTLVTQTTPDPRLSGAAIAFYSMFLNLGMMIGAPIAGAIIDSGVGWIYVAAFAAVCQIVAALCFGVMKLYNAKGEVIKS